MVEGAVQMDAVRAKTRARCHGRCGAIGRRRLVASLAAAFLGMLAGGGPRATIAAPGSCQTPFVVFTDPGNPGVTSQSGEIAVTRDAGLLGEYGGNGRFAGYTIDGSQELILNTATGMARAQGTFVATSPDGASTIFVSYTGQVDFVGLTATGNFVAGNGTGSDAGYRASGTLLGDVTPPATLTGANVGLC